MLIEINNTHQSSGLTKVCDFAIETNGVMIKALTSRLYSNPIGSIVRELASNALDACPTSPMEISMPSALDPQFRIRDYGPGLSPQQMVEVFTRFGASTKRTTNTQIGGFGLGAKSPFAVVNSYAITSYHGGTRTSYLASITANGMPTLHQTGSAPTAETGLEITVPASDPSKWREALDQIHFFEPSPLVDGDPLFQPEVVYRGTNFFVLRSGKPRIMVGPVSYPLDQMRINHHSVPPFVLQFAIGELEVTASREEVVYSPATIALLDKRIKEATAEYRANLSTILAKCTTVPEIWRVLEGSVLNHSIKLHDHDISNSNVYLFADDDIFAEITLRKQNRVRWVPRWTSGDHLSPQHDVYVLDDTRRWQERIQFHRKSRAPLFLVKDPASLDLLGIPYTRISSIPTISPLRSAPRPRQLRTLAHTNKLVVTAGIYEHYIEVDANLNIKGTSIRLTFDLMRSIAERLKVPGLYVIPHNHRGGVGNLSEALPLWEQAALPHLDEAKAYFQHHIWATYHTYNKPFVLALSRNGLVPIIPRMPTAKHLDITTLWWDKMPAPIDWQKEIDNAVKRHPLLKPLKAASFGFQHADELTSIVSLIIKE